jgi:large subunit ribosomal protein L25
MANEQINSEVRDKTGKGEARRLRESGQIPGIFYGPKATPAMISLNYSELEKVLRGKSAENIIFDLNINSGKKAKPKTVMIKELQIDPVTRSYLHVDLYEIALGEAIEVNIPVILINTPIGVTNGGILQHTIRELSVSLLPKDLVEKIEIDVSNLDIGETIHIRDVLFPPGLTSTEDEGLTVATVVAPAVEKEVEEVEEEEVEAEEEDVSKKVGEKEES